MKSKIILLNILLITAIISCGRRVNNLDTPPKKPNIIVMLTDDQRWDALGFTGNTSINTPNIDALAKQGT